MDAGQDNTSYHILFRVVSGSMAAREDCWYFLSYTVYESGFAKYSFGLRLIPSPVVGADRERESSCSDEALESWRNCKKGGLARAEADRVESYLLISAFLCFNFFSKIYFL